MCDVSKRPRSTVACCYETYRVRREGTVQSPVQFVYGVESGQTDRQKDAKEQEEDPAAMLMQLTGNALLDTTN